MVSNLAEIVETIPGFNSWPHPQKIQFFAWYIHTKDNKERFMQRDIRACYDTLHLAQPSDISTYLLRMQSKKPKEVLRDTRGHYLERRVREQLDTKYGQRKSAIIVDKLLQDLLLQVTNPIEQPFLSEALTCFRYGAFRAAIVITWNLTYDHLCNHITTQHLHLFNIQLPKSFPKARIANVSKRDDFSELKESEVLQVCRSANLVSNDVFKILKEKLDRRNSAAHPSSVVITQLQAEDFITDVINNVVLKLT